MPWLIKEVTRKVQPKKYIETKTEITVTVKTEFINKRKRKKKRKESEGYNRVYSFIESTDIDDVQTSEDNVFSAVAQAFEQQGRRSILAWVIHSPAVSQSINIHTAKLPIKITFTQVWLASRTPARIRQDWEIEGGKRAQAGRTLYTIYEVFVCGYCIWSSHPMMKIAVSTYEDDAPWWRKYILI